MYRSTILTRSTKLASGIYFLLIICYAATCVGQVTSIEFSDFKNPKRVGIDDFVLGTDNLIVGFDVLPNGTAIPAGTVINSADESVGLRFSAILTHGPHAGDPTDTQALDHSKPPNPGPQIATSALNILRGVNPNLGANASGTVAGRATLIVTFLTQGGDPGQVSMVGAFNDTMFGQNTLTVYSGLDATGTNLGFVEATGPGEFFRLQSTVAERKPEDALLAYQSLFYEDTGGFTIPEPTTLQGIGSITFSGTSTEIDDLTYSAVVPEPTTLLLAILALAAVPLRVRPEGDVVAATQSDGNWSGFPEVFHTPKTSEIVTSSHQSARDYFLLKLKSG